MWHYRAKYMILRGHFGVVCVEYNFSEINAKCRSVGWWKIPITCVLDAMQHFFLLKGVVNVSYWRDCCSHTLFHLLWQVFFFFYFLLWISLWLFYDHLLYSLSSAPEAQVLRYQFNHFAIYLNFIAYFPRIDFLIQRTRINSILCCFRSIRRFIKWLCHTRYSWALFEANNFDSLRIISLKIYIQKTCNFNQWNNTF